MQVTSQSFLDFNYLLFISELKWWHTASEIFRYGLWRPFHDCQCCIKLSIFAFSSVSQSKKRFLGRLASKWSCRKLSQFFAGCLLVSQRRFSLDEKTVFLALNSFFYKFILTSPDSSNGFLTVWKPHLQYEVQRWPKTFAQGCNAVWQKCHNTWYTVGTIQLLCLQMHTISDTSHAA